MAEVDIRWQYSLAELISAQEEVGGMGDIQLPWRPPRGCDVYWTEFKHCKSLLNRFHHYYTYGTSPVCLQWKDDYEACREWETNRSPHAKESLQKSERNRMSEQKNFPPFWEMRQKPPADWHLPLNDDKLKDS